MTFTKNGVALYPLLGSITIHELGNQFSTQDQKGRQRVLSIACMVFGWIWRFTRKIPNMPMLSSVKWSSTGGFWVVFLVKFQPHMLDRERARMGQLTTAKTIITMGCSEKNARGFFQSRNKSLVCGAFLKWWNPISSSTYPLVNKHRPWKSPIFNGN